MRRSALLLLLAAAPLAAQPEVPPLRVLRSGGLRVETAALLMSGQEGGTIPLATLVVPMPGPMPGAGSRSRVAVLLEVDGAETVAGQTADLLRLEICLYAITNPSEGGPGGRVAGSRMDTVEIDLSRLGADLERSGLKYVGELELPPGDYALRTLVRNAATGEVGLRSIPVAIPDFSQRQGLLLPPLLPEPAGAWLVARGAGLASDSPLLSPDSLPSARPILAPATRAEVRVAAWKLEGDGLRVEVRRPGGARVAAFPLEISGREASAVPGLEIVTASFEPKGVEEGVYELRALPAEGRGDDAALLSTSFVLLNRGAEGQVWAALTQPRQAGAQAAGNAQAGRTTPPARRGKRTRRIDAGPVKQAYRQALAILAGGDRDAARAAILALETSTLTGDKPASSEDLIGVELDVAREVTRGGGAAASALVPLLTLHQVIYRDAVRRQAFLISTHDRELVFRLAALYAELDGTPAGRKKAARFLDGIAAEMIWTAPPSLRARLFQQILSFDPEDRTALLCMAVDAERQGRYAEAAAGLERLDRIVAGDPEARLRLAVNLARIGKVQEARRILAEVAKTSGSEPWQAAVAAQELARLLIAAGDLDAAEAAVREGLGRLPDDDKLALQLGMIRDLRKDPRGAREAVARVGIKAGGTSGRGGEARHRYNRMPLEDLDRAWSELQQNAADLLPTLAEVLGVPGPNPAPTP
ncbi:MAG: tetratricopeptide repeat protein [Acidobacteriota bacterium]